MISSNVSAVSTINSKVLPRVTAVIVTFNGEHYIEDCLGSLLKSSKKKLAVLVVDNASNDGTVDLVRRKFPEVQILSTGGNLGYGKASNLGVQTSQAEYIAIVNQDVISTPGWIEHLVAALDEDHVAALATPKILLRNDPDRINTCGNAPHYTGITPCRGYNRPAGEFSEQEQVAAVSGAAFVIRRTVFESLGGFDPTFFLYLEDTELSFRASLAGYSCLYVPEAVVLHDFKPRFSAEKIFFLERNRLMMVLKTYRLRTLLVLGPALLMTELAVWGYSLMRGPRCFWGKFRSYFWLGWNLPGILRARRQVQSLRRAADNSIITCCTTDLQLGELEHPLGQLAMSITNPLYRFWYHVTRRLVTW